MYSIEITDSCNYPDILGYEVVHVTSSTNNSTLSYLITFKSLAELRDRTRSNHENECQPQTFRPLTS